MGTVGGLSMSQLEAVAEAKHMLALLCAENNLSHWVQQLASSPHVAAVSRPPAGSQASGEGGLAHAAAHSIEK